MSFKPSWLSEVVYERKYGYKDLLWELDLEVPAKVSIVANVVVPKREVWYENGYEFEPDALNVFRVSHWHDGRLIMNNILLTESILSWRYTKPEIVTSSFTVLVTNIDSNPHFVHVKGLYRSIPRDEFNKIARAV